MMHYQGVDSDSSYDKDTVDHMIFVNCLLCVIRGECAMSGPHVFFFFSMGGWLWVRYHLSDL